VDSTAGQLQGLTVIQQCIYQIQTTFKNADKWEPFCKKSEAKKRAKFGRF